MKREKCNICKNLFDAEGLNPILAKNKTGLIYRVYVCDACFFNDLLSDDLSQYK